MIDGAFLQGTLEMPQTLENAAFQTQFLWNGILLNRILAIACIIFGLLVLADTVLIFPRLLDCIFRWRACIRLEHNLGDARARNSIAHISVFAFGLLCSRFCLYRPSFVLNVPAWSYTLICMGVVCGFFILRFILFWLLNIRLLQGDEKRALFHNCHTFAIPACCITLVTTLILSILGLPDDGIRTAILLVIGATWLLEFIRSGQLLGSHYSGLTTFLYLCALELIPAATVVASALVL